VAIFFAFANINAYGPSTSLTSGESSPRGRRRWPTGPCPGKDDHAGFTSPGPRVLLPAAPSAKSWPSPQRAGSARTKIWSQRSRPTWLPKVLPRPNVFRLRSTGCSASMRPRGPEAEAVFTVPSLTGVGRVLVGFDRPPIGCQPSSLPDGPKHKHIPAVSLSSRRLARKIYHFSRISSRADPIRPPPGRTSVFSPRCCEPPRLNRKNLFGEGGRCASRLTARVLAEIIAKPANWKVALPSRGRPPPPDLRRPDVAHHGVGPSCPGRLGLAHGGGGGGGPPAKPRYFVVYPTYFLPRYRCRA